MFKAIAVSLFAGIIIGFAGSAFYYDSQIESIVGDVVERVLKGDIVEQDDGVKNSPETVVVKAADAELQKLFREETLRKISILQTSEEKVQVRLGEIERIINSSNLAENDYLNNATESSVSQYQVSSGHSVEDDLQDSWEEDDRQNQYLARIENLYLQQNTDIEWAENIELMIMRTVDYDKFQAYVSENNLPEVEASLITVTCRETICDSMIQAEGMSDLVHFQEFIIRQLSDVLPSTRFGTVSQFGNNFQMRVFFARDNVSFDNAGIGS